MSPARRRALVLLLALAVPLAASRSAQGASEGVVRLPGPEPRLTFADVDGDGDRDLVCAHAEGIDVHRLDARGSVPTAPTKRFPWPAPDLAWCLADLDGPGGSGRVELVGYVAAREVRAWSLDPGAVGGSSDGPHEGRLELSAEGQLPRGRFPIPLARDLDGDGRLDLVLPRFGRFSVYLRGTEPDGPRWEAPLEVELEARVDYELGSPDRLDARFGQEVRIPWFSIRDVDGDGDRDLLSETQDRIGFHLAQPRIASRPTWVLDLAALRAELPKVEEIDFDDLLANLGGQVDWSLADLDGSGAHDLLLQVGSKFRLYLEGSRTGPAGPPDQVLKASGNVLGHLLEDLTGDGRPDLVLFRGERLSLARVLRWLVLPGGVRFDLFSYRNEGGAFSKRPTKRNALVLEFPRLLQLLEDLEELEQDLEDQEPVPARELDLDGDGLRNDVADAVDGELRVYRDVLDVVAEDADEEGGALLELLEPSLLEELGALPDGGTKTFQLDDLLERSGSAGAPLRSACKGHDPWARRALVEGVRDLRVHAVDLDGVAPAEVVVLGREEDGAWVAQIVRFTM